MPPPPLDNEVHDLVDLAVRRQRTRRFVSQILLGAIPCLGIAYLLWRDAVPWGVFWLTRGSLAYRLVELSNAVSLLVVVTGIALVGTWLLLLGLLEAARLPSWYPRGWGSHRQLFLITGGAIGAVLVCGLVMQPVAGGEEIAGSLTYLAVFVLVGALATFFLARDVPRILATSTAAFRTVLRLRLMKVTPMRELPARGMVRVRGRVVATAETLRQGMTSCIWRRTRVVHKRRGSYLSRQEIESASVPFRLVGPGGPLLVEAHPEQLAVAAAELGPTADLRYSASVAEGEEVELLGELAPQEEGPYRSGLRRLVPPRSEPIWVVKQAPATLARRLYVAGVIHFVAGALMLGEAGACLGFLAQGVVAVLS